MRPGRRIAIDVGAVRIGLAISDAAGLLASPLSAISRERIESDGFSEIGNLISEYEPIELYVGLPLSLAAGDTSSTKDARNFANQLADCLKIPVRMIDERLSTVTASAKLRDAGLDSRRQKTLIDSMSAVEILEFALEIERKSGKPPGIEVQ